MVRNPAGSANENFPIRVCVVIAADGTSSRVVCGPESSRVLQAQGLKTAGSIPGIDQSKDGRNENRAHGENDGKAEQCERTRGEPPRCRAQGTSCGVPDRMAQARQAGHDLHTEPAVLGSCRVSDDLILRIHPGMETALLVGRFKECESSGESPPQNRLDEVRIRRERERPRVLGFGMGFSTSIHSFSIAFPRRHVRPRGVSLPPWFAGVEFPASPHSAHGLSGSSVASRLRALANVSCVFSPLAGFVPRRG